MQKKRVLIVEDEVVTAMSIRKKLENQGYDVVDVVDSGEQSISLAKSEMPDLILMDIMLEGDLTGIEAAEQIRKEKDIPIVFLTAYSDDETLEKAKLTEPYSYILKPFQDRELICNIEIALHMHQLQMKLKQQNKLMRELNHRTKNNMGVIISLLQLNANNVPEEKSKGIFYQCINQINSMRLVQEKLCKSPDLTQIFLDEYIEALISELMTASTNHTHTINIEYNLEHFPISVHTVVPLGLVINEIITNSIKFAFKEKESGEVTIKNRNLGENKILLEIGDNGIGLPEEEDLKKKNTLGQKLIKTIIEHQLSGTLEVTRHNGTHYKIVLIDEHRPQQ